MPKIIVAPDDIEVEASSGQTIFEALMSAGIEVPTSCNGHGTCGLCRVVILEGENDLSPITKADQKHLGNVYFLTKTRLACQALVNGEVVKLKIR